MNDIVSAILTNFCYLHHKSFWAINCYCLVLLEKSRNNRLVVGGLEAHSALVADKPRR